MGADTDTHVNADSSALSQAYAACSLEVTFYEVHGKKCYDLLDNRKVCKLLADESEVMHLRGAKSLHFQARGAGVTVPASASASASANVEPESRGVAAFRADLMETKLAAALALRSAELTERNPVSSRSHAVCEIMVTFAGAGVGAGAGAGTTGRLRLVDLAGSERNYETLKMTAKQHQESGMCVHAYVCVYLFLTLTLTLTHTLSLSPPSRHQYCSNGSQRLLQSFISADAGSW